MFEIIIKNNKIMILNWKKKKKKVKKKNKNNIKL